MSGTSPPSKYGTPGILYELMSDAWNSVPEPKDPTKKQYIVWGTDDCWNDHETASRGSEKLLAITGSSSLIEASYRTKLPSGITYWRVELREDEIPKVQDLLEVRIQTLFVQGCVELTTNRSAW